MSIPSSWLQTASFSFGDIAIKCLQCYALLDEASCSQNVTLNNVTNISLTGIPDIYLKLNNIQGARFVARRCWLRCASPSPTRRSTSTARTSPQTSTATTGDAPPRQRWLHNIIIINCNKWIKLISLQAHLGEGVLSRDKGGVPDGVRRALGAGTQFYWITIDFVTEVFNFIGCHTKL